MAVNIATYYIEGLQGPRAEVILRNDEYLIEYYDAAGDLFQTESFPGKSVHFVESAAENWTLGIKVLNG